ncbi:MAG TPA: amino acid--[acyl-carrier-protein] ligase [Solirubrobacteraceae bacterium]|nr:amino acid--[acyl-carrier-protein] ligase [Solirubrobacteraceae bacterium]
MAEAREATPEQAAFLQALVAAGLLLPSGVPGVFGRGATFEDVREAFDALVTRSAAADGAERLRFPPVMPRRDLETIGYLKSFPHLAGTIFSFEGDERAALEQLRLAERHEDWSGHQSLTDLVLSPAGCYPVYPAIAARGPLAPGGVVVDIGGAHVFRHEPSDDPARMQTFHMRELVRLGEPEAVAAWRDAWRDRAVELLRGVGLDARPDVASDPFFGRTGQVLARSQRAQQLKFEILAPVAGQPTAIASFNYHRDHFTGAYEIAMADGGAAHTACLGFGLERVTLALLDAHGLDPATWPADVRAALWPAAGVIHS